MSNPFTLALLTAVSTVALTATSYTQSAQPNSTTAPAPEISLTGCLEQTSGPGLTPAYVLNNSLQVASTTPRMGDPRIGTVGSATSSNTAPDPASARASGAAAAAAAPAMYALDGRDGELAPHVGHRVAIIGTMAAIARPATAPASATAPAATGTSGSTSTAAQRINVTSVRMVAESCATK